MSKINKLTFKVMEDDKEIELAVRRPDAAQVAAAQAEYSRTFHRSLLNGDILREALDKFMVDQGLWDDSKQQESDILEKIINDGTAQLMKGGIKKSDAKNIAISVKLAKITLNELMSIRNNMYNNTVEGKSDDAKFNYLVSVCTVYNDSGKSYFSSLDDYLNRSDEPAAYLAAATFANLYYSLDPDFEKKLPENRFLREFGFMDESGQLVDQQGRKTDLFGRLIDDEGNYIDEDGKKIDVEGNKIDFEFQPFLDDEETVEKQTVEPAPKEPKKRGRKKISS